MQINIRTLKQEFLKKWIEGLEEFKYSKKNMGILERKKAIKSSADLAMATARKGTSFWSQTIIAKATQNNDQSNGVEGTQTYEDQPRLLIMKYREEASSNRLFNQRRKIMKRSVRRALLRKNIIGHKRVVVPNSHSIAKQLVKKRTHVLKGLIPGGKCLDQTCLIMETLDYIVSLQAQVDVMRCLATAAHLGNGNN